MTVLAHHPHMAEETFKAALIRLFRASGMSMAALSRESGVSYDVLNKLIKGDNKTTSPQNTVRLARVLGSDLMPTQQGFSEDAGTPSTSATDPRAGLAMPTGTNDLRVSVQNGQLIVNAAVDKKGIATLEKMIAAYKEMLE